MDKIYLVRHTKVDIAPGVCYGITDVPVATTFNEEVKKISEKLNSIKFSRVFSSPLKRCSKLAEVLAIGNVIIDKRLQELNFGNWEGIKWDDIYNTTYGKKWMDNYLELRCPEGESYLDLHKRAINFIQENFQENINPDGDNTLIVTHAGIIRAFLHILSKIPLTETFSIDINYGDIFSVCP